MKKLDNRQFQDRIKAIQRARKIFIESGLTNNISVAFEIYQRLLAEEHRDIFLRTFGLGRRPHNWVDFNYIRPTCPDCAKNGRKGIPLYLRVINLPKGPRNMHGYRTAWICTHPDCIYESFSTNTVDQWLKILPTKNKKQEVRKRKVEPEDKSMVIPEGGIADERVVDIEGGE